MGHYLHDATERKVDILGFPEMNITGYADPTCYPEAVLRLDGAEIRQLLEMTQGLDVTVLAGLIEGRALEKPFITQVTIRDGQLLGWYRKVTIKDEETEWFSAGDRVPVFQHGPHCFGIAICADISNEWIFAECGRQGAEIVFELAAPGLYGEQVTRDWRAGFEWWEAECQKHLSWHAKMHGFWIAVATQAGRTIDEDFPGGGYLFAPGGRRLYATTCWAPGAVYLDIDLDTHQIVEL
jgi:predicted amidohydrolase